MPIQINFGLGKSQFNALLAQGETIMAGIADIKTDVVALKQAVADEIAAVQKDIADLKAQIAAGGTVSQADLDSIHTDLGTVIDALKAETTATTPTPPNPNVP